MRRALFLLCALCLVSVDAEAKKKRRAGIVVGAGEGMDSAAIVSPESFFEYKYSNGRTSSYSGSWEKTREVDKRTAQAVTGSLTGLLSAVKCELPESSHVTLLLWPDGRREYLWDYQMGAEQRRLSPAQGMCLGEALERAVGPRFSGDAMVVDMTAERGARATKIKDVRWFVCGDLCSEMGLMESGRDILTDAMWSVLVDRDLRPDIVRLIEAPRDTSSSYDVDMFFQLCMRNGLDSLVLDEGVSRAGRQWFAVQRVFCAARWGVRDADKDAHILNNLIYKKDHYKMIRVLAKWTSGDVGDLLALWRAEGSFVGVTELYWLLSHKSMPTLLAYSPWVLHARGALLERLDPARHDKAVALVKLAALHAAPAQRDEYERHVARMGASPGGEALVAEWVEERRGWEAAGARDLKALEMSQTGLGVVMGEANRSLYEAQDRAHKVASVRREEPRAEAVLGAQELTWLQKMLLVAIAMAGLVLGWLVWGRLSRR
jgi:hypothetical protein